MPEYVRPECRGGFPEPVESMNVQDVCPWCGQPLNRQYEYEPRIQSVARTEGERDTSGGRLAEIFGWSG